MSITPEKIFWHERFCACFVLKFTLQKEEGEKRKGVQILKQSTQNLSYHNIFYPCTASHLGFSRVIIIGKPRKKEDRRRIILQLTKVGRGCGKLCTRAILFHANPKNMILRFCHLPIKHDPLNPKMAFLFGLGPLGGVGDIYKS